MAFGSVEPNGNCWLEPGSSVRRIPSASTRCCPAGGSRRRVWTALSSPSTMTVSEVTTVGSSGSSTMRQTRPFVDRSSAVSWAPWRAGRGPSRRCRRRSPCRVACRRRCPRPGRTGTRRSMSLQYSRTHCGPSVPSAGIERGSSCHDAVRGRRRKADVHRPELAAVRVLAGRDVRRNLDEVALDDGAGAGKHVVVALDSGRVRDEGPQVTVVGEQTRRCRGRCRSRAATAREPSRRPAT